MTIVDKTTDTTIDDMMTDRDTTIAEKTEIDMMTEDTMNPDEMIVEKKNPEKNEVFFMLF